MEIENEVVIGKIAPGIESIRYKKFKKSESCGATFNLNYIEKNIVLFPNPTRNYINVRNTNSENSLDNFQVKIFDIKGRELALYIKEDEVLLGGIWSINIQDFPAGVYIIKVSGKSAESFFKIAKQ